ncbi:MAG: hypothetical protein BWY71_02334 [Planctomycetes bacterium ADurb.Bin412]|nr:MAG: hypothetical protein BWY71_02334 [Planctomycetes bacterium ADurb.Bin412]
MITGSRRNGVERGNRPALQNKYFAVRQAPLYILRAAKVFFDASSHSCQPDRLLVGQRRCRLHFFYKIDFICAALGPGIDSHFFPGDLLFD